MADLLVFVVAGMASRAHIALFASGTEVGGSDRPWGVERGVTALGIILTVVLVLVNAFFVIAEYALVRSRRPRLETMADEGLRGARLALSQFDKIGDYISGCQVGITMASIGIGAVGEPAIAHVLEPALGPALGLDGSANSIL